MAVNKGSAGRWKQAQEFAAAGKMGKAKEAMEKGGGTWSKDIHKNLKFGTEFPTDDPDTGADTPDTSAPSDMDNYIEEMRAARAESQRLADELAQKNYDQGQQKIADAAKAKTDRMNYWKRPGLASTILSNNTGEGWLSKLRKKRSFLTPFSSIMGGGNQ